MENIDEQDKKEIKERAEALKMRFNAISEDIQFLISQLTYDAAYWEFMIRKLRRYPQCIKHPRNETLIKPSPVSRQLERAQVQYTQIIKTLVSIYNRAGGADEGDLLDEMLNEFTNS